MDGEAGVSLSPATASKLSATTASQPISNPVSDGLTSTMKYPPWVSLAVKSSNSPVNPASRAQ